MLDENRQTVKNQHYVPCCVMVYFRESNIVSNDRNKEPRIYHFLNEKRCIYPTTINNAMSGKNFYEHKKFRRNWLEDLLKGFEGNYSSLLKNIVTSLANYKSGDIQLSELKKMIIKDLHIFLIMRSRSGAMFFEQKYAHESDALLGIVENFDPIYIKKLTITIRSFYDFCIIESYNASFLISDQFISTASLSFKGCLPHWLPHTNRAIGLNNTLILIPISKHYYICFWTATAKRKPKFLQKDKINKLTELQTIEINKVIINNSYIQTVGPSKPSLESVIGSFEENSPNSIYLGWDDGIKPGRFHGADKGKEVFFYDNDRKIYEASSHHSRLYKKVQNNDLCPCGSGITYKSCCRHVLKAYERYVRDLSFPNLILEKAKIPDCRFIEKNIFQW